MPCVLAGGVDPLTGNYMAEGICPPEGCTGAVITNRAGPPLLYQFNSTLEGSSISYPMLTPDQMGALGLGHDLDEFAPFAFMAFQSAGGAAAVSGGSGAGGTADAEAKRQLECAKHVVNELFDLTGLSSLASPKDIIVGEGNWISFGSTAAVTQQAVLALKNGGPFDRDLMNFSQGARSLTSPSLHLKGLGTGLPFSGHIDSWNVVGNPIGHAMEALSGVTHTPCDLLAELPPPKAQ